MIDIDIYVDIDIIYIFTLSLLYIKILFSNLSSETPLFNLLFVYSDFLISSL